MKTYKTFLKGTLTFLNGVYPRSQRDGRRNQKIWWLQHLRLFYWTERSWPSLMQERATPSPQQQHCTSVTNTILAPIRNWLFSLILLPNGLKMYGFCKISLFIVQMFPRFPHFSIQQCLEISNGVFLQFFFSRVIYLRVWNCQASRLWCWLAWKRIATSHKEQFN